jgi:hypothetical protein
MDNPGPIPVYLYYEKQKEAVSACFLPKINGSGSLMSALENLLGQEMVVLRERSGGVL